MRGSKQCRRRYARPKDPRTLAQMRCRGRLSAASSLYSQALTAEQQDACIAAGAKVQSRRRMNQSGPLTGQQYWIHEEAAREKAQSKATNPKTAPQISQPQRVTRSTSGTRRSISRVPPDHHRLNPRLARNARVGRKPVGRRMIRATLGARSWRAAWPSQRAIAPPGHVWRTPRVIRNTVVRRRRQSQARGAVEALK